MVPGVSMDQTADMFRNPIAGCSLVYLSDTPHAAWESRVGSVTIGRGLGPSQISNPQPSF